MHQVILNAHVYAKQKTNLKWPYIILNDVLFHQKNLAPSLIFLWKVFLICVLFIWACTVFSILLFLLLLLHFYVCPHHMHFLVKLVPNGQHNSQCSSNCHDWLLGSKFRIFNTYCFVFCGISVTLTFDFLCFQWTQSSYTLLDEIFMLIKIPLLPSPHGNIEQSST